MALYDQWCDATAEEDDLKQYFCLTEKADGRAAIAKSLAETVRGHYDCLERIAEDIRLLGYDGAAEILRELLPTGDRSRAGDLGEILASEFTEERLQFEVPVRRMRFKDGREVPMRGDDFIGVTYCVEDEGLWLAKGEAKSRATLDKTTVTQAREALNKNGGRCTPSSLLFVANRLLEGDEEQAKLGRIIRTEVGRKALSPDRIDHVLFTLSGNGPIKPLKDDLAAADAGRNHAVVNLHIEDYADFIAEVYAEAGNLGDD